MPALLYNDDSGRDVTSAKKIGGRFLTNRVVDVDIPSTDALFSCERFRNVVGRLKKEGFATKKLEVIGS